MAQDTAGRSKRRIVIYLAAVIGVIVAPLIVALWIVQQRAAAPSPFARQMQTGKNYYDQGETNKAIAAFQKAVELQPEHPDARLNLANAYRLAGQADLAIREAQQVLDRDPNSAAAHYIQGCARLRLRQWEEAVKALQQAKDLDPGVAAVAFQLGRAHQELGHWEDAIREYQEVLLVEPEHPAANYTLSQALLRAGREPEANEALERHRQIQAKNPGGPASVETYERSKYTEARLPFQLEQPARRGVRVQFADVTAEAFGGAAGRFSGPVGVVDFNHDGRNSLFVFERGQGFRLLGNRDGRFQARGEPAPGIAGGRYHRCLVADLQPSAQDRFEDVLVLGDRGSHVFKFATNGAFTEVTQMAGLADLAAVDGALVDLDFTGKLDLLTIGAGTNRVRVFRNLGNLYFTEMTSTSGVPADLTAARQLVIDDCNNDDLLDVVVARTGQPPLLLAKIRGGPLAATNSPATWPAGTVLAAGDLNNDIHSDLVAAAGDKLICAFGGLEKRLEIPATGGAIATLTLVDFDNDGWLDILAAGDGLRLWRNIGQAGFHEVTKAVGLDRVGGGRIESVIAADFDGDCDVDLLLDRGGQGLQLLRNNGGNANKLLKARLLGNRSNPSGIGIRVDAVAGGLRVSRRISRLPVEIGVGQYAKLETLNARWFNLDVSNIDVDVSQCEMVPLFELVLPEGSCPYLYSWDGKGFRFVTDLLGTSPAGLRLSDTRFIEADTDEIVWIADGDGFPARDGQYVLQITEELREVLYLDTARLWVVDHPPDTEVHPTGKLVPAKPWPLKEVWTLHRPRRLERALRHDGQDVTGLLRKTDGQFVSPARLRAPQLRGLAEPHSVALDFGPLEVDRPLVLALTGWLRFGGGMANVAASHHPDLPFPFPTLEVEVAGRWQPVDVAVGAPAGKTKTILVDLNGKLPAGSRRLRLSAAFELHWDRIALFERADESRTRITRLVADHADLHWRGFSEFKDLSWQYPLTPEYERVFSVPKWTITPSGWCTRYGDVRELIDRRDNALALLNGGDELTLRFAAADAPDKPEGARRDFFLWTVGWDKDADFHCELGWLVEPIPWHGMNDQLYGKETRPVIDGDWWIKKYNTRWVAPRVLQRAFVKKTER